MKIRLTESALISLIEQAIVDDYGVKKNLYKQLTLSQPNEFYEHEEEDDDRPDNWRELPGYNPDYFYGTDKEESWRDRLTRKIAGVSDDQAKYNREHGLPNTWRGSKEGYHEYITKKTFPSGSN